MPKTTKSGKVDKDELPSTLQRSDDKAQRTFAKAHDAAAEQYGDEERADRVAFSALKDTPKRSGTTGNRRSTRGPPTSRPRAGSIPTVRPPAVSMRMLPKSTCTS